MGANKPRVPPRSLRLHEGFVGERELIGTPYLADPARREEYEREIAPRTTRAVGRVLARMYGDEAAVVLPPPLRCLDLGAGTGAAGETVRAFFGARGRAPEVVSVDRVPGQATVVADLEREDGLPWLGPRFDLIVAAHLLNELHGGAPEETRAARLARLVSRWMADQLAPAGVVVLVEPALRETSRLLLAVRDKLVEGGDLQVLAPCLSEAPCPARLNPRDWCHDTAPPARAHLANPVRPSVSSPPSPPSPRGRPLEATRVDFSFLVLTSTPRRETAPPHVFRLVSDHLVEKGRTRIYGCGTVGRTPLIRLRKHDSATNTAFGTLERGDLASLQGTEEAADGRRIVPTSAVERLRG